MPEPSHIFKDNYQAYCKQIEAVDIPLICDRLGIEYEKDAAKVRFFDKTYSVSGFGIFNDTKNKAGYVPSVILSQYILLCPDQLYLDSDWCTFRDFKKDAAFTNANYFTSDTTGLILKHYSGKVDDLRAACMVLGGKEHHLDTNYDLSMVFEALPRISLLLLFNEGDDLFGAYCQMLFQRQSEYYLDPESLAMITGMLAKKLVNLDKDKELS